MYFNREYSIFINMKCYMGNLKKYIKYTLINFVFVSPCNTLRFSINYLINVIQRPNPIQYQIV